MRSQGERIEKALWELIAIIAPEQAVEVDAATGYEPDFRFIFRVGGGGNVRVDYKDRKNILLTGVQAGEWVRTPVVRIYPTSGGTTATAIVAYNIDRP